MKKTNIHNVPDIKDTNGKWIKSYCPSSYTQCHTRAGKLWHAVNFRCKIGGLTQNNRPTYLGVTNGFKDFQEFAEWCQHQYGYMNKEENGKYWALDKDLKIFGSKEYSRDSCIFIPSRINGLLLSRSAGRGKYPLGVHRVKQNNKFRAACQVGTGIPRHLGYFDCPMEAHKAWQRYKIDLIRRMILEDQEVKKHLELVKILIDQANRIEYDLLNNIETN